MDRSKMRILFTFCLCLAWQCSAVRPFSDQGTGNNATNESAKQYSSSGTIILSRRIPVAASDQMSHNTQARLLAPVLGYFPPASSYVPAANEAWLEIDSSSQSIALHQGETLIKKMSGIGEIGIGGGRYFLRYKQKDPLWHAPDDYYSRRQIPIPDVNDSTRNLRGALGVMALYPTASFPIHCSALWTPEVGGLRISASELATIYNMLDIGASVVVK